MGSTMVSRDFPSDLSQDFAGESLEKVLGSDLRRAPLHWVLPMEILGDTKGGFHQWGYKKGYPKCLVYKGKSENP